MPQGGENVDRNGVWMTSAYILYFCLTFRFVSIIVTRSRILSKTLQCNALIVNVRRDNGALSIVDD